MESIVPSPSLELRNTILRAGAGAGKTTTLTNLFLNYAADFFDGSGRFPKVVVTTFTRKATQELKERLLLLALEMKREDLFQYISNKSQVQISTIHGVLSLFLGRYGHRLGLSSDFELLSESQEGLLRRKILRRLVLGNPDYESLIEHYSFQQLEESLQKFYEHRFLHTDFAFIDKAEFAKELHQHLLQLETLRQQASGSILAEASQASWVKYAEGLQTFSLKPKSGIESLPGVLQGIQGFLAENPRRPSFSAKKPAVSTETYESLDQLVNAMKELLDSPEFLPSYWEQHQLKNEIFSRLATEHADEVYQTKISTGAISMSDLELFSLRLISEAPDACEAFSEEWDFWMIDEYQDTSPVQVAILRALVGERKSFIVGDPQQSIYLFRGARSEVFQEKIVEIHENGGEVQEKLINYRSAPRLLSFINSYFERCSDQFAAMEPAPDKDPGSAEEPVAQLRIVAKSERLAGLSEENLAALQRIQELLQKNVSAEKICVLSRTRDNLESLAKAAEAYGIPVQIHVAGGFYRRREVVDALSLLKFLVNPHDNLNFLSCLRSPWLQLSDQEILSYCHSKVHSFWSEALSKVSAERPRHPVNLLKRYAETAQAFGYSFVLRKMLVELGLIDYVQKLDPTGRREANLWKLIADLFQQERTPGFNFLDFLAGLQAAPDLESGNDDSDATPVIAPKRVNLMTVHASKGLQFDHVLLLGLAKKPRLSHADLFAVEEETGRWSLSLMNAEERKVQPSRLALKVKERFNRREQQESLRVLYVAITRAKQGVTLIWEGKPEKNSWGEAWPFQTESGIHRDLEFSYEVLTGTFEPQILQQAAEILQQDPGPWKPVEFSMSHETMAVTSMIASEMQVAAQSKPVTAATLQKALAKAYRGTEAHRIFESLKYAPVVEVLNSVEEPDLIGAIEYIVDSVEAPLMKIIENGHAEWGFSFKHGEFWVQGQIDLWGQVGNEVWLVDYKTGSTHFSETAFEQLQAYAWALHKMGFVPFGAEIHLAVVYPFEQTIKVEKNILPQSLVQKFEQ
jgi:ATP-dependent helicase/nuclease subunit A